MSGSRGAGRLARLAAGLVATSVSDRWAIQPLDDDRVDVIPVKCGVSRGQLLEPLDERLRRQFSPVSASGVDVRLMGGIAHANGGPAPSTRPTRDGESTHPITSPAVLSPG